jgi:hypothetical protein
MAPRGMTATVPASANAFHSPSYLRFFASRVGHHFGMQIMVTALTWQVWSIMPGMWLTIMTGSGFLLLA